MRKQNITVMPGDGIGPEIMSATIDILNHAGCNFNYEYADAGLLSLEKHNTLLPEKTLDLITNNKIALKGPLTTPVGEGFTSINVSLRKKFHLYANVRPVKSIPSLNNRFENVDIITVRENTEGLYSGLGQEVVGETAKAMSIITREGATRICRYAFELAKRENRKKVTVAHKANILKSTSGLFLSVAKEIAPSYPEIIFEEMIIDAMCMKLVIDPTHFDVIVTSNLFGDILSDLCAGLIGGLGLAPGANIGNDIAIFEAVHGSAPDIAGQNIANPTALLFSAIQMLNHLGLFVEAQNIKTAVFDVMKHQNLLTKDLGGQATTTEYTQHIINALKK